MGTLLFRTGNVSLTTGSSLRLVLLVNSWATACVNYHLLVCTGSYRGAVFMTARGFLLGRGLDPILSSAFGSTCSDCLTSRRDASHLLTWTRGLLASRPCPAGRHTHAAVCSWSYFAKLIFRVEPFTDTHI